MADFWGNVSNWWGGISGNTQRKAGEAQMGQAGQTAGQIAGTSEADQMRNAQASASGLAEQQGQTAAKQGARGAVQAARTSGLNAGQAAMLGAQKSGDLYTNAYQGGMQQGMNQYQQATGQRLQAAGTQGNIGQAQQQAGQEKNKALWGGIGQAAGAAATLISDENAKENIEPAPDMLDAIMKKIRPVKFDYKDGEKAQVGVTAQNLEETPLAPVVTETAKGKALDTGKLSAATLDLLVELAAKVRKLEGKK